LLKKDLRNMSQFEKKKEREGHAWGEQNGFLAVVLLEYDLTVGQISKMPFSLLTHLYTGLLRLLFK